MKVKEISIENLLTGLNMTSTLLEMCFSPYGQSIMIEHNGSVLISKDGSEILSIICLDDYLASQVCRQILSFTEQSGDGSKLMSIFMSLIIKNIRSSIDSPCQLTLRLNIIHCLKNMLLHLIPKLLPVLISKYSKLEQNGEVQNIMRGIIKGQLQTKFGFSQSDILTKLFTSYLYNNNIINLEIINQRLLLLIKNYDLIIVKINSFPVAYSNITDGYLLQRNFKHIEKAKDHKFCFILWQISLEDQEDKKVINPSSHQVIKETIFFKCGSLIKYLQILHEKGVNLIISSAYFPEWAVAICKRYSISIVDMIDELDIEQLSSIYNMSTVTSKDTILNETYIKNVGFEMYTIGHHKYVKLDANFQQIVICAPTKTICNQIVKQMVNISKYINAWIMNCTSYDIKKSVDNVTDVIYINRYESLNDSNFSIYHCPAGSYIFFAIYRILNEIDYKNHTVEKISLEKTILEVINLLYKKSRNGMISKYINYLHDGQKAFESDMPHLETIFHNENRESPFFIIQILYGAINNLIHLVRIHEMIIK